MRPSFVNDCFVVVVVVAENDDGFGVVGGGAFDCSWREAGESGDLNPMAPVLLPVSFEFAPAQSFACEFGAVVGAEKHLLAAVLYVAEETFASAKVIDWRKKHEETVVVVGFVGFVRSERANGRAVALLDERWRGRLFWEGRAFEPGLGDFSAARAKISPRNASFSPCCGATFVFSAIATLLSFPKLIRTSHFRPCALVLDALLSDQL